MNDDENKVVDNEVDEKNVENSLDNNIENNILENEKSDKKISKSDAKIEAKKAKLIKAKQMKSEETNFNDSVEDESLEKTKTKKNSVAREIFNWVITLVACILIAKMINSFVIVNARVPSASMENTIMTNDRLIANRLAYVFDEPERGDVVVFEAPDEPDKLFIKRVIGIPGDTIQIHDGLLYLNNELQEETYIKEDMVGSFGPYTVPEDSYFMLGDNRNNSLDARYWRNTYVPEDTILGKAMFTYYPEIHVIK